MDIKHTVINLTFHIKSKEYEINKSVRYFLQVKLPIKKNRIKGCVYYISYNCGKEYKGGNITPWKIRLEDHQKAVARGEARKLGIADHMWREEGSHQCLWNEVRIENNIGKQRNLWLCMCWFLNNLLSRPSLEINAT